MTERQPRHAPNAAARPHISRKSIPGNTRRWVWHMHLLLFPTLVALTTLASGDTASAPATAAVAEDAPTPGTPKTDPQSDAPENNPDAKRSKKRTPPTARRPARSIPFARDKKHVYTWVNDGVHVADTEFKIEEVRSNTDKGEAKGKQKKIYRVHSQLRYESETLTRSVDRQYVFDESWNLRTVNTTDGLIYVNNRHSNKTEKIWKEGSVLVTEIQQNQEEPTRSEILLPGGAYVLPSDGIVVWAVLMPLELPIDKSTDVRIGYPSLGAIYSVKIRNRGSVRIKLRGGQAVDTIRYSFESEKRVLFGDLWVDATGKVVRYQQNKLIIDLALQPAKKK